MNHTILHNGKGCHGTLGRDNFGAAFDSASSMHTGELFRDTLDADEEIRRLGNE